jgi:threonine dehydratase
MGDAIFHSPCAYTETLSRMTGTRLYLKLENLQMTGSFKERGACNKLLSLTDDERRRGVIAASAGNHAQGVAYHAQRLGIDATIVMPEATPLIKVSSTREFGARVVLSGAGYDDAYAVARRLADEQQRVFVHPFDDEAVMAGQGTIGLELLEQNPYLDAVVVSVGGGGLIGGIAVAIKETNPKIKVYGVEPRALPSMRTSFASGAVTTVPAARSIADGIAVRTVGRHTFEVCQRYVDDIVLVDDEEVAEAILALVEREKTVAEGAGAAPLAALLQHRLPVEGKRVAAVVSGGNIDVNMLSRIIERGLVKTGRQVRVRVFLSDQIGALAAVLRIVAERRGNVIEVHHDRTARGLELGEAAVDLRVETRGFEHIEEVCDALREAGWRIALEGSHAAAVPTERVERTSDAPPPAFVADAQPPTSVPGG